MPRFPHNKLVVLESAAAFSDRLVRELVDIEARERRTRMRLVPPPPASEPEAVEAFRELEIFDR
jgi:hypothetical protein